MPGPVLSVPISPSTGNQLGTTGQKAAAARAELKQLEAQLIKMAPLGKIPDELKANIAVAKGRVDELNALQKQGRQAYKDFRTGKMLGRNAMHGARAVADALKSGNAGQLLYGMERLIASPKFARLAGKLNMPNLQEKLMGIMPKAYIVKEAIEMHLAIRQNLASNAVGKTHLREMYAKGQIDAETYLKLFNPGMTDGDKSSLRDHLSGYTFGIIDSRETKRQKLLQSAEGDEDKDRFRRFAMRDLAKDPDWVVPFIGGISKFEGRKLLQDRINLTDKAIKAKEIELQTSKLDPLVEQRLRTAVQVQFEKDHPGFVKMMEEVDKKADDIKSRIDITRPFQDIDASEQYRRDEKEHIAHEVFQEYHHGFVPFNRSSK